MFNIGDKVIALDEIPLCLEYGGAWFPEIVKLKIECTVNNINHDTNIRTFSIQFVAPFDGHGYRKGALVTYTATKSEFRRNTKPIIVIRKKETV